MEKVVCEKCGSVYIGNEFPEGCPCCGNYDFDYIVEYIEEDSND